MRLTAAILPIGLVALFTSLVAIPATADDKLPEPTRAEHQRSQNNLKQIGLAFHIHHDSIGNLPNNTYTKDGKALLSWRVLILPYIEQEQLYKQFKLDEAWDSETNKPLIAKMPKLYAPIRVKAKEGETFYRGFAGKGALFGPGSGKGLKIANIADGTSNTGMVFEAGEAAIWTKPDDMAFDLKKPLPKLGGLFNGTSNVVMCDGSVRRLKKDPDETELKKLIGYGDGEVLDLDKLTK